MAAPNTYTGGYVVLDDTADTVLGGISNQTVSLGNTVQSTARSGETYSRHAALYQVAPTAGFTGTSVNTYIDAFGVTGFDISSLATGLVFFCQQKADGGQRTAGANHIKYDFAEGLVYPMSINVSQAGTATMEYAALITYDGSNDPVVHTGSVSLPTAPAVTEFTLGKQTLAGGVLSGVQSVTIDFGISASALATDGDIYPTLGTLDSMNPTITWSGVSIDTFDATIGLAGIAGTHANTKGYLKKKASGGVDTADGTAEHISYTAAGIITVDDAITASGEGGEDATCSISMACIYDGSNAPLVFNTTTAIT